MNAEEIEKVAHLARLGLGAAEREGYARELSRILDLVSQMNAAATEGVEPMTHPDAAGLRLRDDVVGPEIDRDRLLAGAPLTRDGLYLVPRVIE
ncbi:Asp-tRNA(Asn)/Glu-tRNA(Gln) amidotransferase subunit GatC [Acidiferrobacter sp.]|uniref:Asp-tRNA(Asn)/Glu-tRNA(Gln) amidotransferase subunit GatC n=1 Tax=Acidiferrobacter sp. TaxID=1872107 RepID=UPI00261A91F5|nr:Asp-tRNA(Asn)/Glu-tRNA(Gln) amidotransferase subunit GatC [Acidiferrobacter sp.]